VHFSDRTVVTYDPGGGLVASTRRDGRVDCSPTVQARDVHNVIQALDAGPVECSRAAASGHRARARGRLPDDVVTLVAHEPPLISVLPDSVAGQTRPGRSSRRVRGQGRHAHGSLRRDDLRQGEFTYDYFAGPPRIPPDSDAER